RYAESVGLTTAFELTTPDLLRAADAAWLVSSVRHFAPIRAIDGVDRAVAAGFTADVNAYLGALRE
ncbi:MAG: aminodeoxychorismate lyase, partial [Rhodoglobus sp.]|nr:aminodeoxychorismate lyase [Rhodoglobus sp.]